MGGDVAQRRSQAQDLEHDRGLDRAAAGHGLAVVVCAFQLSKPAAQTLDDVPNRRALEAHVCVPLIDGREIRLQTPCVHSAFFPEIADVSRDIIRSSWQSWNCWKVILRNNHLAKVHETLQLASIAAPSISHLPAARRAVALATPGNPAGRAPRIPAAKLVCQAAILCSRRKPALPGARAGRKVF